MGKVRPLNHGRYGISRNRFKELYYWCLQYNEWKDELRYEVDTVGPIGMTGMPSVRGCGNPTQRLAIRRMQLEENCRLVEQTAIEADPGLYEYILKAVTDEDVTFRYLKLVMGIPCSHNTYYDRRRRFYWLLDQGKVS